MASPLSGALRLKKPGEYGPIGVELALHEMHLVQLERAGEGLDVKAYASVAHECDIDELVENEAALIDVVKRALRSGGFSGRSAVAAMPATFTQVMPVSYQSASAADDGVAIAKLMRDRVGELSEFVIDYLPVQTLYEGKEKLALVAISREETVVHYLEMLRKAGLKVGVLEVGPIAIRRYVSALQPTGVPRNTLVVNCGREKSYLTLLSDERLLADDEVDFGEASIVSNICQALDMSEGMAFELIHEVNLDPGRAQLDEAKARNAELLTGIVKPAFSRLAQDIQRSLMFAQSESRGARTNQVYLLGSIARWPGAAELVASLTNVAVDGIPSPLAAFGDENSYAAPAPELAVATGLALKGFMTDA